MDSQICASVHDMQTLVRLTEHRMIQLPYAIFARSWLGSVAASIAGSSPICLLLLIRIAEI
jgi:hypothetical protein